MERIACLMYHEIEVSGRSLCSPDPGYVRYVVSEKEFREQMEMLASAGFRGISVRDMPTSSGKTVAITFDDGAETDLLVAAPILHEFGHGATFFVSAALVGRPGYLNEAQLRELSRQGFEVGSHGATHRYLTDLGPADLRAEVHGGKERIEEILGSPITGFSAPGGRWNATVLQAARNAGFRSFSTSEIGVNRPDDTVVKRVAIQRGLSPATLRDYVNGRRLASQRVRAKALKAAKMVLGNTLYDRLWRSLQALRP